MLGRTAAKRDLAEPAIVQALEGVGCTVVKLSIPDVPDLLVGYRGQTFLLEVKTGNAKLRPGQERFASLWQGPGVRVVTTPDEALEAIGFSWRKR